MNLGEQPVREHSRRPSAHAGSNADAGAPKAPGVSVALRFAVALAAVVVVAAIVACIVGYALAVRSDDKLRVADDTFQNGRNPLNTDERQHPSCYTEIPLYSPRLPVGA